MFSLMSKSPQEYFKMFMDYASLFPKNEREITESLEKIKLVLQTEVNNSKDMWNTLQKATTGDASMNEILAANKQAKNLLIATRFAFILALPGSIFILPLLIEFATQYGIDLIPASVRREFNLK